jgi:signal transduction histidine kinase
MLSIQLETNSLVMISISDTGIGIPVERLSEVFEPFHQLDDSSTRRVGGTGLGLALVQEIIQAHGSMIEVESEEGKGSTFRFPFLMAEELS